MIPISVPLKPGKPEDEDESYRHISIFSPVAKFLEKWLHGINMVSLTTSGGEEATSISGTKDRITDVWSNEYHKVEYSPQNYST